MSLAALVAGTLRGRFLGATLITLTLAGMLVLSTAVPHRWPAASDNEPGSRPTSADLEPSYRLGTGQATLDLRDIPLGANVSVIRASVGTGDLAVIVANGAAVQVRERSGIGGADVIGDHEGGVSVDRTTIVPGVPRERPPAPGPAGGDWQHRGPSGWFLKRLQIFLPITMSSAYTYSTQTGRPALDRSPGWLSEPGMAVLDGARPRGVTIRAQWVPISPTAPLTPLISSPTMLFTHHSCSECRRTTALDGERPRGMNICTHPVADDSLFQRSAGHPKGRHRGGGGGGGGAPAPAREPESGCMGSGPASGSHDGRGADARRGPAPLQRTAEDRRGGHRRPRPR